MFLEKEALNEDYVVIVLKGDLRLGSGLQVQLPSSDQIEVESSVSFPAQIQHFCFKQ